MEDCIFCKIANGEISADIVHQNENFVVFRDINPKDNTHLLVVPKKHIPTLMDIDPGDKDLLGEMLVLAKDVASQLSLHGYNLQLNVGKEGGQEIFHIHLHLMSKFS